MNLQLTSGEMAPARPGGESGRAMNPLSISRLIFDTVPQLYEAEDGPYRVPLRIAGEDARVFSLAPLSPRLERYLERAFAIWAELRPMTEGEVSQIIEREWIQQKFVVDWLESRTRIQSWGLILDYARRLNRRLTENQVMAKTLVIEPGRATTETLNLADPDHFKVLDWLGSSPQTYFRVTEDLHVKAYEALNEGGDVRSGDDFRFYPGFLHPVLRALRHPDAVVVHLSENGSILVADREGVIASKRALESWTVYDIDHVVESVGQAMERQLAAPPAVAPAPEAECVACSLFQILFDIAMKRHGGLLILDDPQNLPRYVIKGIERGPDPGVSPLNAIFTRTEFSGRVYSVSEVRKLVELSSVDGALILDPQGNLVQVGSMIVSHPLVPNRFGTREAAAFSAAKHGATAFKVSADGHMTLFFTTPRWTGNEVHRFDFR